MNPLAAIAPLLIGAPPWFDYWPFLAVAWIAAACGSFGFGLVLLMAAPERHRRALDRAAAAPWRSAALGLAAFLLLALIGIALFRMEIRPGRGLVACALFAAASLGLSVSGRLLAERLLPERGALAQTAVGLGAFALCLLTPLALPALLVAAPLGLGAWLAAAAPRS